jgi:hypothetical protein
MGYDTHTGSSKGDEDSKYSVTDTDEEAMLA